MIKKKTTKKRNERAREQKKKRAEKKPAKTEMAFQKIKNSIERYVQESETIENKIVRRIEYVYIKYNSNYSKWTISRK